jgi:hypothetical protein
MWMLEPYFAIWRRRYLPLISTQQSQKDPAVYGIVFVCMDFVGAQRVQRLKDSFFKWFLELSRGDFGELTFLRAILNPSIVLMGQ